MTISPMSYEEFDKFKYDKQMCETLNSFDTNGGGHAAKVAYAKSLTGDNQRWAFAWIRFQ